MLALSLRGWTIPYPEYLMPLAAGLAAGGVAVFLLHLVARLRTASVETPLTDKKDPEYDPFVHGSASEQRKAYRRSGNPVELLIALHGNKKTPCRGWVTDRSVGGLCVESPAEVAPGTVLEVLPANAPAMTPWIEIEVRSCRLIDQGWQLGCQFVRQPPWSILLLFG
jgi:hypothetical protein